MHRNFRLRSLKSRIALWVLLPGLALVGVDVVLSRQSAERTATLVQQQLLYGSARVIAEQVALVDGDYELSVPPAAFEMLKSRYPDRVFFAVRARDGRLIAGDDDLPPAPVGLRIDEEAFHAGSVRGEAVRVVALAHALASSSAGEYTVTQVAQTLQAHDALRDGLLRTTLGGHLILFGLTVVALAIALKWTIRPLLRFSETLRARRSGSLERIDASEAPSELAAVIGALNDYVTQLDRTLGSYEKFVAETAHHLRNAFAIIATQINFGKRAGGGNPEQTEVLEAIGKTLGNCTRVINQLLTLAAIEQKARAPEAFGEVRLAEVIGAAIDELALSAQQQGIELGVDAFDEAVRVRATPSLLREVFANLIGNAIRHLGRPGTVIVSLRGEAGRARVCIRDDGPGIPSELHEQVFERFFRLDEAKPGSSGLGLAIVRETCALLGATVRLCTPEGGGLQVDLDFPAAGTDVQRKDAETNSLV